MRDLKVPTYDQKILDQYLGDHSKKFLPKIVPVFNVTLKKLKASISKLLINLFNRKKPSDTLSQPRNPPHDALRELRK